MVDKKRHFQIISGHSHHDKERPQSGYTMKVEWKDNVSESVQTFKEQGFAQIFPIRKKNTTGPICPSQSSKNSEIQFNFGTTRAIKKKSKKC